MRIQHRLLATLLALLATAVVAAASDGKRQPYLLLAGIDVRVTGEQRGANLIEMVQGFASARGYRVKSGHFPKRDRLVTNFDVIIKEETFWTVDNFMDPHTFRLGAYSHDERAVWEDAWNELVSKLASEFGEANIARRK